MSNIVGNLNIQFFLLFIMTLTLHCNWCINLNARRWPYLYVREALRFHSHLRRKVLQNANIPTTISTFHCSDTACVQQKNPQLPGGFNVLCAWHEIKRKY